MVYVKNASSLKEEVSTRLMFLAGNKLNAKGEIVIKLGLMTRNQIMCR
jgi:hypothetical protein